MKVVNSARVSARCALNLWQQMSRGKVSVGHELAARLAHVAYVPTGTYKLIRNTHQQYEHHVKRVHVTSPRALVWIDMQHMTKKWYLRVSLISRARFWICPARR